ncbi:MAG: HindVP family restriction endonuclease [Alphaproteobacteria bacterium]|nr:HindVP family restriction endonuclease [Alphaproteobacteria bacterium]MDA8012842.1 HindVP family restriction endonuclease [Alphaproteobacteria bacterium]
MSGETLAAPSLYGLTESNSNRTGKDLWGKNQFNSTFPVSLCCYMRDRGLDAVYLAVDEGFSRIDEGMCIAINDLFGATEKNPESHFAFEAPYSGFSDLVMGNIDNLDLIISDGSGRQLRPIEIKLTVVPDSATQDEEERCWAPELIVRPVATLYAALQVYCNNSDDKRLRNIVEPVAQDIQDWNNRAEILAKKERILSCICEYFAIAREKQQPFLMQPIWKTLGQSPDLADPCFDVFVWSDCALFRIIVDEASREQRGERVSRSMRECVRLLKVMYDAHTVGTVNRKNVTNIDFGSQTDKAVAFNGNVTRKYMGESRLLRPSLERKVLKEIILNGGERCLKPERRFDASLYFNWEKMFPDS